MMRRLFRRLGQDDRGAELIEFAIVILLLLVFLFGIIEFGWIFNGYITLEAAAKEGARLAVVDASNPEIIAAVKKHAFTFQLQNEEILIAKGHKRGVETTVTVRGQLPLLTGFFPFINNPFPLEAIASMIQER